MTAASPRPLAALAAALLFASHAPVLVRADEPTKDAPPPIPADKDPVTTKSGLKYTVLTPGAPGPSPKMGDAVEVYYRGWLPDGRVFDEWTSKEDHPWRLAMGQVGRGWFEALKLMTAGAKWKLTLPPALAYGKEGAPANGPWPAVPPDSEVIYVLELAKVVQGPPYHPATLEEQKTTGKGVRYMVLKEGEGTPPGPEDAFEMKFALFTLPKPGETEGTLLDSTEVSGKTIRGRAVDMDLQVLQDVPSLLKPGSRYRFEVPPDQALGERTIWPELLPPDATSVWELEMVRLIPLPPFRLADAPTPVTTTSGLKVQTLREGTGASPGLNDRVTVEYVGWLQNGRPFDASYYRGKPSTFDVSILVPGFAEGLQRMKEGGVARLTIPPGLGYGAEGQGETIPPNATIVFHVELKKVERKAAEKPGEPPSGPK
jgi:FKBP-type peptidyl-prolyl cis-trans isomerase